jgi:adenosine deaminase
VNLSRADLLQLARNSFTGSFLDKASIDGHLASIDAYAAAH